MQDCMQKEERGSLESPLYQRCIKLCIRDDRQKDKKPCKHTDSIKILLPIMRRYVNQA
jgi:hypothetical protein